MEGPDGTLGPVQYRNGVTFADGVPGGLAPAAADNGVGRVVLLTNLGTVSRTRFFQREGRWYLELDGAEWPVAENVACRNKTTNQWTDLTQLRGFSDDLTVWADRPLAEGGVIRLV